MPPVGTKRTSPNGAARALRYATPPAASAGKNLRTDRPQASASVTSVGVQTPGTTGMPRSRAKSTTAGSKPGATMKLAPARTAASAWATDSTVPAPTRSSGTPVAMAAIAAAAASVRNVISAHGRPASTSVRASGTASSARGIATTGTRRTSARNDAKPSALKDPTSCDGG